MAKETRPWTYESRLGRKQRNLDEFDVISREANESLRSGKSTDRVDAKIMLRKNNERQQPEQQDARAALRARLQLGAQGEATSIFRDVEERGPVEDLLYGIRGKADEIADATRKVVPQGVRDFGGRWIGNPAKDTVMQLSSGSRFWDEGIRNITLGYYGLDDVFVLATGKTLEEQPMLVQEFMEALAPINLIPATRGAGQVAQAIRLAGRSKTGATAFTLRRVADVIEPFAGQGARAFAREVGADVAFQEAFRRSDGQPGYIRFGLGVLAGTAAGFSPEILRAGSRVVEGAAFDVGTAVGGFRGLAEEPIGLERATIEGRYSEPEFGRQPGEDVIPQRTIVGETDQPVTTPAPTGRGGARQADRIFQTVPSNKVLEQTNPIPGRAIGEKVLHAVASFDQRVHGVEGRSPGIDERMSKQYAEDEARAESIEGEFRDFVREWAAAKGVTAKPQFSFRNAIRIGDHDMLTPAELKIFDESGYQPPGEVVKINDVRSEWVPGAEPKNEAERMLNRWMGGVRGEGASSREALRSLAETPSPGPLIDEMTAVGQGFRDALLAEFPDGMVPAFRGTPGDSPPEGRVLDSWSLDPTVAHDFADGITDVRTGAFRTVEGGTVEMAEIPIEDIIHGFANGEFEILVVDRTLLRELPGFPLESFTMRGGAEQNLGLNDEQIKNFSVKTPDGQQLKGIEAIQWLQAARKSRPTAGLKGPKKTGVAEAKKEGQRRLAIAEEAVSVGGDPSEVIVGPSGELRGLNAREAARHTVDRLDAKYASKRVGGGEWQKVREGDPSFSQRKIAEEKLADSGVAFNDPEIRENQIQKLQSGMAGDIRQYDAARELLGKEATAADLRPGAKSVEAKKLAKKAKAPAVARADDVDTLPLSSLKIGDRITDRRGGEIQPGVVAKISPKSVKIRYDNPLPHPSGTPIEESVLYEGRIYPPVDELEPPSAGITASTRNRIDDELAKLPDEEKRTIGQQARVSQRVTMADFEAGEAASKERFKALKVGDRAIEGLQLDNRWVSGMVELHPGVVVRKNKASVRIKFDTPFNDSAGKQITERTVKERDLVDPESQQAKKAAAATDVARADLEDPDLDVAFTGRARIEGAKPPTTAGRDRMLVAELVVGDHIVDAQGMHEGVVTRVNKKSVRIEYDDPFPAPDTGIEITERTVKEQHLLSAEVRGEPSIAAQAINAEREGDDLPFQVYDRNTEEDFGTYATLEEAQDVSLHTDVDTLVIDSRSAGDPVSYGTGFESGDVEVKFHDADETMSREDAVAMLDRRENDLEGIAEEGAQASVEHTAEIRALREALGAGPSVPTPALREALGPGDAPPAAPAQTAIDPVDAPPVGPPPPPVGPPASGILPPAGGGEPPARDPRFEMPERGEDGIAEILAYEEEVLLRRGRFGDAAVSKPIIRDLAVQLNPSLATDRAIHVAYNAQGDIEASLATVWKGRVGGLAQKVEEAWDAGPPTYVGPEDKPWKNTIFDLFTDPASYTNVTPQLRGAVRNVGDDGLLVLAEARDRFDVDVDPFVGKAEGYEYLPTVNVADDILDQLGTTAQQLTSTGRTKTRFYERPYDRWEAANKKGKPFIPESDFRMLLDRHRASMATMAGNNTFRTGSGGLTQIQLMDLVQPGLRDRRIELTNKVASLGRRIDTASRNVRGQGSYLQRLETEKKAIAARKDPIYTTLERLREDQAYGTELSFLAGQHLELQARYNALDKQAQKAAERLEEPVTRRRAGEETAQTVTDVETALADTKIELARVQAQYAGSELFYDGEVYIRNGKAFRYYPAAKSKQIDRILGRNDRESLLFRTMDEIRALVLNGDGSIATIHGSLAMMMDPVTSYRVGGDVIRAAKDPDVLSRLARDEPDVAGDFARDTGFEMSAKIVRGEEFQGSQVAGQLAQGVERLPVIGQKIANFNESMWRAVIYRAYQQYKVDRKLLMSMGYTKNTAGREAAEAIFHVIPRINPRRADQSAAEAAIERRILVSPSFARAPALLVRDAVSGMVKLSASKLGKEGARESLTGREIISMIRLMWLGGTVMALSASSALLSAEANGLTAAEALKEVTDPTNGRFASLVIGNKGSVGLGGPIRSFLRAFAPRKNREGKLEWPAPGLWGWARGKRHPGISAVWDQIDNADYFGNPVDEGVMDSQLGNRLLYFVESIVPIWAGQVLEGVRQGETPGRILLGATFETAGQGLYQRRPGEDLDRAARARHGEDFFDLTRSQQQQMKKDFPALWKRSVKSGSDERQEAELAKDTGRDKQSERDELLLGGTMNRERWLSAYYDGQTALASALKQIYDPEQKNEVPFEDADNAFEEYINKIYEHTGKGDITDWDAVNSWRSTLDRTDDEYITANTGVDRTAVAQALKPIAATRRQMLALPKYRGYTGDEAREIDDLWQRVKNEADIPENASSNLFRARMIAAYNEHVGKGSEGPVNEGVRKRIIGTLRQTRDRSNFKAKHPEMELFYGSGPLTADEQKQLERLVRLSSDPGDPVDSTSSRSRSGIANIPLGAR
jgi:hypothetical protein